MPHVQLVTLPQSFASGVIGARDLLQLDGRLLGSLDPHMRGTELGFETELVGSERRVDTTFGPPLAMDRVLHEAGPADVVYVPPLTLLPGQEPDCDPELLDWHDLGQNACAAFRDNRQHGDTVVQRAQDWLRDNPSHPEPVEGAIAASGLPRRSFHRRFRQATGHTPIRYVHNLRVEHAKDLLEAADSGVEDIAWQVGYEDAAYFRRLFRRITGLSPAQYRKAFRTPANIADQVPQ